MTLHRSTLLILASLALPFAACLVGMAGNVLGLDRLELAGGLVLLGWSSWLAGASVVMLWALWRIEK